MAVGVELIAECLVSSNSVQFVLGYKYVTLLFVTHVNSEKPVKDSVTLVNLTLSSASFLVNYTFKRKDIM